MKCAFLAPTCVLHKYRLIKSLVRDDQKYRWFVRFVWRHHHVWSMIKIFWKNIILWSRKTISFWRYYITHSVQSNFSRQNKYNQKKKYIAFFSKFVHIYYDSSPSCTYIVIPCICSVCPFFVEDVVIIQISEGNQEKERVVLI